MKRTLIFALLAGMAFGASAQSVGTTVEPTVANDLQSDVATRDVRDHTCLRETGSLIVAAQNRRALRNARAQHQDTVQVKCSQYGRAYTQDDIRRTGATDLSQALRQLDPSIY